LLAVNLQGREFGSPEDHLPVTLGVDQVERGACGSHRLEARHDLPINMRVILDRRQKGKGWLFSPMVAIFWRQVFKRNTQQTLKVLAIPVRDAATVHDTSAL
jgi:hypothetical protein